MRRAIALSQRAMAEGTGPPFGAVVVRGGRILEECYNQSRTRNDPMAHGEIVAIRLACESIGSPRLDGCTIYTSSEPCPMCLSAIYWAHIELIYYANDTVAAKEAGFDDTRHYQEICLPAEDRTVPATQLMSAERRAVFNAWQAREKKLDVRRESAGCSQTRRGRKVEKPV